MCNLKRSLEIFPQNQKCDYFFLNKLQSYTFSVLIIRMVNIVFDMYNMNQLFFRTRLPKVFLRYVILFKQVCYETVIHTFRFYFYVDICNLEKIFTVRRGRANNI